MSTNPMDRPSFVKLMDSTQLLALPPVIVQEYGFIMQLANMKLRISTGETWNVKLQKREDEDYYFTRGWKKFAQEIGLKIGEFLVFWCDGNSTFDVAVYMQNACEREIQIPPNLTSCKIKSEAESTDVKERSPLYFEIFLKKHQESRVTLPRGFWRAAGLGEKESVRLVYLPNNSYEDVVLDPRQNKNRIDLTTGWSRFRKENGLDFEKSYSFEFIPSNNVIHVKKIK